MRKVIFLLIASFFITLTACNKEKINRVNPNDITVNLNKAELQERIVPLNFPVTFNSLKASADATPIPELWAIAQINPGLRTYTVWHWELKTDVGVLALSTATGTNPDAVLYQTNTGGQGASTTYDEELSTTGAAVYDNGANTFVYFSSHVNATDTYTDDITGTRGVYGGEIFAVRYDNAASADDATALKAEASIFDNTADYNDLTIDLDQAGLADDKLWITGDNNARGAIVRNIVLEGSGGADSFNDYLNAIVTPNTTDYMQTDAALGRSLNEFNMPILGPSGNSVSIPLDDAALGGAATTTDESQQLWVVAGGQIHGGLVVMDKDDNSRLYTRVDVAHAKHFDMCETPNASGFYGAFLWGNGLYAANDLAYLRIFNTSSGPFSYKDFTVPADVTPYGKNAIDVEFNDGVAPDPDVLAHYSVYMAMGEDGVLKVDASSIYAGASPPPTVDALAIGGNVVQFNGLNTYGGTGLANGLVVHGDFVYVAWGASGLVILDKYTLAVVGQYNGIGSCNYVAVDTTNEDILFAGFGRSGMIMFKFVDNVNP